MKAAMTSIGTHLQRKIFLYRQLIDVLLKEQTCLKLNDIDKLWALSRQKSSLALTIETERTRLLHLLEQEGIHHGMNCASFRLSQIIKLLPDEVRQEFDDVHVTLTGLKQEVGALTKTNRRFVEDSLKTINDLLALFTQGKGASPVYSRGGFSGNTQDAKPQVAKGV